MLTVLFTFCISLLLVKFIINSANSYFKLAIDDDTYSIQKFHEKPVPRIGGVAIFISILLTSLLAVQLEMHLKKYFAGLIVVVFIVFIGGLYEDLTKSTKPIYRILMMQIAVLMAIYLTKTLPVIHFSGFKFLDFLLENKFFAILLTSFCVIGLTNAYNIIDGYNGLSATAAIINLFGIIYLANVVRDYSVIYIGSYVIAATLAFSLFNYPYGKLFLGDCGAYVLGFIIAILSIHLVQKYNSILSCYSVLLLSIYPISELALAIFRRKFISKTKGMQPDCYHLHQLVYNKVTPKIFKTKANFKVLPLMLPFMLPQAIIATSFYNNQLVLITASILYLLVYVTLYVGVNNFKY